MEGNETFFFSNKGNLGTDIKLIERTLKLLKYDPEEKFPEQPNTFFKNTVSNIEINENR